MGTTDLRIFEATARIRAPEAERGVAPFDRHARGVTLTPAGRPEAIARSDRSHRIKAFSGIGTLP